MKTESLFTLTLFTLWNTCLLYLVYYIKYRDNPFRYWRVDLRAWKSILKGDFNFGAGSILPEPGVSDMPRRKESPDDYWDGEVNYETGEVNTDAGPSIRHPKNRDRAYSGSVERFHDGGGQDA